MLASARFLPRYCIDYLSFVRALHGKACPVTLVPSLSDKYTDSGVACGHYFHQDLWAARRIFTNSPARHVDIGSRVDGFVAHLLVFRQLDVFDVRKLHSHVAGLNFVQADLTQPLSGDRRYDSLSCLHALEHFGLGRYGDPIDPKGWEIALDNFARLLNPNGLMYLSVPIGTPCIEFNTQRIFDPTAFIGRVAEAGFRLLTFSYIDDDGHFYENVPPITPDCKFGCGCFEFARL